MALMLLDTYGLVYRAYFALPGLTTSTGTPINAVYGFTMMLNKLIADEKPTHVVAAFDKGTPAERVALYAEYKAQRRAMPDELRGQFALVRQVLATYRIPVVEMEGQEADDVIATLARQAQEAGEQTIVVTGDLDLLQIVDDRVTVLVTRRGITELGRYDPLAVRERFGLEPSQLPDYRGLKGDPSDNLPGIPGVGEKTASKLLQAAGSLDALVSNPGLAGNPKLERLIEEYGQQACLCRAVSVVRSDLPLMVDWEGSRYTVPSDAELYRLYSELEFKTLLARLQPSSDLPLLEITAKVSGDYRSYVPSVDPPEFASLAQELLALRGAGRVVFAPIGDAIGVTAREGQGVSFSVNALSHENVRDAVRGLLDGSARAGGYDVKKLVHIFHSAGIDDARFSDDAMIAAHLLDPTRGFADVEDAASQFLGLGLPGDAAAAADAAFRLIAKARIELERRGQLRLYEELELPLAPVLARMEEAGMAIDSDELRVVGDRVDTAAEQLRKHIYDFAGEEFNIGSPQQLGKVLFGKLNIPGGKKTKTGFATGVEVLQGLAREYPICALVLEWREVTKLKNTYVDVIPQLVDEKDGRLRTEFNQTATATGRLSSTNPNLQNIPVRSELGRQIRAAFTAEPGWSLLSADYSQIELRILAHCSADPVLTEAFRTGQDIHSRTAQEVFGVGPMAQTAEHRRAAKIINFGIIYGLSAFGLAQQLGIGQKEAAQFIAAYFARYSGVKKYLDGLLEETRRTGVSRTVFGRTRPIPEITSAQPNMRSFAERTAMNTPLQGTAADLIKIAMIRIHRELREGGFRARMILQVHDELLFESPADELDHLRPLVKNAMEQAYPLSVPLLVDVIAGPNWRDMS